MNRPTPEVGEQYTQLGSIDTNNYPTGTEARFAGADTYGSSRALAQLTVNRANSLTSLTVSPTGPVYGENVNVRVAVSGSGLPTGTVTLQLDSTNLGSFDLNNGSVLINLPLPLALGNHTVKAAYAGNANFINSEKSATFTVNKATSNLTLLPASGFYGSAVTISATLMVNNTPVPSQTVSFTLNGVSVGSAVTGLDGVATKTGVTLGAIAPGTYPNWIGATFAGNTNYNGSSVSADLTVAKAIPVITVTSSPNPSLINQSVTFTATVAGGAAVPTGTVTLKDGANLLYTGSLNSSGRVTYTTTALAAGQHTILAEYSGNSNYLSGGNSITQTVNMITTSLTVSAVSGTFGGPATLSATLKANGKLFPGRVVNFKVNGQDYGNATTNSKGLATKSGVSLYGIAVGSYPGGVVATFVGDTTYGSSSASATLTVKQAVPIVKVTSSLNPSLYNQNVTFTITVTGVDSSPVPTGTVTLKDGTSIIYTGSLLDGQATFTTFTLTAGTHTLSASYSGNGNYTRGTNGLLSQVVNPNPLSLVVPPIPASYNSVYTVDLKATLTNSTGGVSGKSICFSVNGQASSGCAITDSSGVATLTVSLSLSVGSYTIVASFAGDTTNPSVNGKGTLTVK